LKPEPAVFLLLFLLALPSGYASDWEEESSQSRQGAGAAEDESETRSGKQGKFFLQGRVQHADRLPALADDMRAGANYKPDLYSQHASYASSWFKIPSWFAGTFKSDHSTIEYIKDYATGRTSRPEKTVASSAVELHGFQSDVHGAIWHYYVKSGSSRSEQEGHITYNTIDWYGPEFVSEKKVVMRVLATSLLVDKARGVILDSFRREDIKTYEPSADGAIQVSYTSKSFDSRGLPRDLQNGRSLYRRIASFRPINRDENEDYRQKFRDFLHVEKMDDLAVPE